MNKELVIIYDTPEVAAKTIETVHNLSYYRRFFDRIQVLYWCREKRKESFSVSRGTIVFHPYSEPYSSSYLIGLKYMAWIFGTLWRICRQTKEEMVFMPVIPVWAGLPSLLVAKLKREKIVLRLEAQKIDYFQKEGELEKQNRFTLFLRLNILKLIYRLTLPFYNLVIGISPGVCREAKKYGARETLTVPIFINLKSFLDSIKKKNSRPTLLFVGQIKKAKGLEDLIKAVKTLKQEGVNFKLLIVGRPANPKDEIFLSKIEELSRDLPVEFLGWLDQSELAEVYCRADIFVLPSYSEALGMVTMEAMACGLPVVATQTSGSRYLVEDNKTGFLVPIGNVNSLKEKIGILLKDEVLRESMGRAGKKRIQEILAKADKDNKELWTHLL